MVEQLLEELLIRKTLETFMRRMDDGDAFGVVEMFTPDGTFRVSGKEIVGHAAIADFLLNERHFLREVSRWQDEGNLMAGPRGIHLFSCPIIEIAGDTATSEVDCVTVHRDAKGAPQLGILCRYRDRLVRHEDGRWLIADRTGVALRRRQEVELAHLPTAVRNA